MADIGNIFDNSATITPSLEGQGEGAAAEVVVQEPEVIVAPDEGQAATEQEPTWKSEFKSEQEMYEAYKKIDKSYTSLRPEYTKVTQEYSALKKSSQPVDNQVIDPQTNPVEALLAKVKEIVNPVKEQNDELVMQTQVSRIMHDNPDFAELAPTVSEILKAKPYLWNDDSPIETALELARARKGKENLVKLVTDTRNQAYADKELKILNSTGTKTPVVNNQEKTEEEMIRESIMSTTKRGGSIF